MADQMFQLKQFLITGTSLERVCQSLDMPMEDVLDALTQVEIDLADVESYKQFAQREFALQPIANMPMQKVNEHLLSLLTALISFHQWGHWQYTNSLQEYLQEFILQYDWQDHVINKQLVVLCQSAHEIKEYVVFKVQVQKLELLLPACKQTRSMDVASAIQERQLATSNNSFDEKLEIWTKIAIAKRDRNVHDAFDYLYEIMLSIKEIIHQKDDEIKKLDSMANNQRGNQDLTSKQNQIILARLQAKEQESKTLNENMRKLQKQYNEMEVQLKTLKNELAQKERLLERYRNNQPIDEEEEEQPVEVTETEGNVAKEEQKEAERPAVENPTFNMHAGYRFVYNQDVNDMCRPCQTKYFGKRCQYDYELLPCNCMCHQERVSQA